MLYGSHARGDARPDSDVDLLVVLEGEVAPYVEIRRTGARTLRLLLTHGVDVSMQPFGRPRRSISTAHSSNVEAEGVNV